MAFKRKRPKSNNRAPATAARKDGNAPRDCKPRGRCGTRLTPKELEEFQVRLLDKRRELVGDVRGLQSEAVNGNGGGGGGSNAMPIHMAERASDTWEQALTLRLSEPHASILHEIDAALRRIQDETYGICEAGGERVSKGRLRAVPWAKYCVKCARQHEVRLVSLSRGKHREETEAK